ncbi:MAG: hypothetical protein QOE14_270 [Humisphaera sp.]|nr:hypothetical protein [Humisphaera sp.]
MTSNTDTAILDRLIAPERDDLSAEVAGALLRIDFREDDVRRMDELAALARDGALSPDQQLELESYNRIGHLLALIHSKARRSLNRKKAG